MKLPHSLIAGLGIALLAAAPLVQAGPGPDDHGPGQGGPGGPGGHPPAAHGQPSGGPQPPRDFGPVRQSISDHRGDFGQGRPMPPGVHLVRGQPLPHGYGRPLDRRAMAHLPRYEGYEWRRVGPDVVLVAIGTSVIYEILSGVLD
ncbi:anti-virulence regulator CigR family protein [Pseudomonas sp. KNUC1026]|uniref:anti-virulence regulator CigR family protein n=1 Tax=Pseudomonas sp. KNUC1026 TaxID=2893890 RepID=UPI001F2128B6|nr:anti-virulence regulator CigR family protein [Pseudomonas sp. KNUC1026]UFH49398.1 RcnB family protein [Pseudomonas sp. KNUC1026]